MNHPLTLDDISLTGGDILPPKIVIYGEGGLGKTRVGINSFVPVFLPFEEGLGAAPKGIPGFMDDRQRTKLTSWQKTMEAMTALAQGNHNYGTLVVDSLEWLEPLIWAEVCREHKAKTIEEEPKLAYQRGYKYAVPYWRTFINACDWLRHNKNMAILMLCHAEIKERNDPTIESYDLWQMSVQKYGRKVITDWADIVGFAHLKTAILKEKGDWNKVRNRAESMGIVLHVGKHPAYRTKTRYAIPAELPLEWSAIVNAIQASKS